MTTAKTVFGCSIDLCSKKALVLEPLRIFWSIRGQLHKCVLSQQMEFLSNVRYVVADYAERQVDKDKKAKSMVLNIPSFSNLPHRFLNKVAILIDVLSSKEVKLVRAFVFQTVSVLSVEWLTRLEIFFVSVRGTVCSCRNEYQRFFSVSYMCLNRLWIPVQDTLQGMPHKCINSLNENAI